MTKQRTFTPRDWQGLPLEPIKGAVHTLFGVPMVVHKVGPTWSVSEPITGRSIKTRHSKASDALLDVGGRIEMIGGVCALGSNMADVMPRLSLRQVHDAVFLYGAGGPLDAPDLICTGVTKFSLYHSLRVVKRTLGDAYQVGVPR